MFPNIDNNKGIEAVRIASEKRENKTPSTKCIVEALEICLYRNNSIFKDQNLLQINGTATGAPNSCSYSDLAIYPLDEKIILAKQNEFSDLFYFGRYRDDCFSIWTGSLEKLNQFLNFMNSLDEKLQFTMEVGKESICFLDLNISIVNSKLCTSVYSKPTDSHLYLHSTSCHHPNTVKGISKGVSLRLRRICSTDADYKTKSKEYMAYLVSRGHVPNTVLETFDKIGSIPRKEARKTKKKSNLYNDLVVFATTYNPVGPNISNIVKKHKYLLLNNPASANVFKNTNIVVANKRCSNLKELMLRGDPYNITTSSIDDYNGYIKCNKKCDSCMNFVIPCSSFVSEATGKTNKVRCTVNCNSKNVIYLAFCTKCKKQGVGSTTTWKPRLRNYKSQIKLNIQKSCCIAKHFMNCCSDVDNPSRYLKFKIIDHLNNTDNLTDDEIDKLLLRKEQFWIGTLITMHKGLNSTHDWSRRKRTEIERY